MVKIEIIGQSAAKYLYMRKLTNLEINNIIDLYITGWSLSKLKKKFRLQINDVKTILIDHQIRVRNHRESRFKYRYNENYFENIDTEEKAYWLGFIFADGFITKKTNGSFIFGISLGEIEPLQQLNLYLQSTKPIKCYKKKNGYSLNSIEYKLAFCSNKMVLDLEKWGCVENKTFKLKFPTFLSSDLIPHFIRGYFDGDGSVFLHKQKVKYKSYTFLGVQFCGTLEFLTDLAKYINAETCIYKDKRKLTNCYRIQFNSNVRSLKLYHYMYKSAKCYISRKKLVFDNFVKDRGSTTIISSPTNTYKYLCYLED